MGHLGLTPQFVHSLGGYKVQGKTHIAAERLKEDAFALEQAGCFAIVLECCSSTTGKRNNNFPKNFNNWYRSWC